MGVKWAQGRTNKFIGKRIRITKNGKLISRRAGHNHFNAKASRHSQLKMKRSKNLVIAKKLISRYLSN